MTFDDQMAIIENWTFMMSSPALEEKLFQTSTISYVMVGTINKTGREVRKILSSAHTLEDHMEQIYSGVADIIWENVQRLSNDR